MQNEVFPKVCPESICPRKEYENHAIFHFSAANLGVEHVYETPKHESNNAGQRQQQGVSQSQQNQLVTSPTSSARSSRLSAGSNGFFRDSGNDTMYTSSGMY